MPLSLPAVPIPIPNRRSSTLSDPTDSPLPSAPVRKPPQHTLPRAFRSDHALYRQTPPPPASSPPASADNQPALCQSGRAPRTETAPPARRRALKLNHIGVYQPRGFGQLFTEIHPLHPPRPTFGSPRCF